VIGRIVIEFLLFLTPFGLFLLYRAASRDMSVRDRWPLTMLVTVGAILAAAGLIIIPLLTPSAQGKCFEAARYEDGRSIPGRMVDCDQVSVPEKTPAAPPTERPVAPRDQSPSP
jgi:Family of unknown function (DUF6111)